MVIQDGVTLRAAAAKFSVSAKTAAKGSAVIGSLELPALPIGVRGRTTARSR